MLQRLLLDRLLIGAVAAAALALGSPWPAVANADAAQVTVVSPGGMQRPLSLDALAGSEDVAGRAYVVRSSAGEESRSVTGFSLAAVLEAAGADPFSFSYLEVQRPVGGSVLLSRHQALDPGAFAEGPPVIYATTGGTGFLRPAVDSGDANGDDSFEVPQGVTVVLRKGSPLQVKASASTVRTKPGKPVEFSAEVQRSGAGEQLSYSWYFDDGGSASGPSARHTFSKRGSYDVVVGVTTPGDDVGASAVVTVQVGGAVGGGPDRKGGGSNRAADAPDSGVATGPSGPGDASTTGAGAAAESLAGELPPPTTAPAPVPTPAPAESAPTPEEQPPPEAAQKERADLGEQVSGLLLSDSGSAPPPTPDSPSQQAAARTGTLDGGGSGGSGLSTAALGLLATAGLLGAGALLEARGIAGLLRSRRLAP